ncbi:metal-dependent transcriptional regulator, partial [archaeon]
MRKQLYPYRKRFEDYIKAIYKLQREKSVVRVRDLAAALNVKPPSVVEQLRKLSQRGLVLYEKGEYIKLTDKGEMMAREILRKHEALRRFLADVLMVPEDIAERDSCYMEHGLHEITIDRINKFLGFIDEHFKI